MGETACGRFSDIVFVAAGKKRGFCRLRSTGPRKSDRLPVHQRALRTILLIQAIEETDRAGEVIPLADRADASRAAMRDFAKLSVAEAAAPLTPQSEAFLLRRADRLLARLRVRSPAVMQVLALSGGLTWLGRIVLVLAVAAGVSLSALDGSRRINILAFPLIGLIAWNLIVYILLIVAWLRSRGRPAAAGFWSSSVYERWISSRIEALMRHSTRFNVPLTTGLRRFVSDWGALSQPLLMWRAKRLLHLAAALMAIGLIIGLYVRGIALRYEAGWESTFLGPESAHALVAALYGPASALSGISYGSLDNMRTLRWTAAGGGGEAASWIHLIALTAVLYIVLPRLLAAYLATFGLWRYSRRPPIPPSMLGYARALILSVGSGPRTGPGAVSEIAMIIPYAYEPSGETRSGLQSLLAASLGPNLSVVMGDPIRYGDEETLAARMAAVKSSAWTVLLMTLASTPEVENHGALIGGLRDWLVKNASAVPLLIVIDEGPYAYRMRGDAGFEQRVKERCKLWREFVASYGLRACFANLAQMRPGAPSEIDARDAARAALWTASEST
jgi:hypothetical protein